MKKLISGLFLLCIFTFSGIKLMSADGGLGCPPTIQGCEWSYIGYTIDPKKGTCDWFKATGNLCSKNGRSVWCCNDQEIPQ